MFQLPTIDTLRGRLRFLLSLVPSLVVLVAFFAVLEFVTQRVHGGVGVAAGIIAGACLALGVMLFYWNAVDWLNLRIIRRHRDGVLAGDGHVVAVSGEVRVEGTPLSSPFSDRGCAAYTYRVAESRRQGTRRSRTRYVLAQGFHMLRTRIVTPLGEYALGALPQVEDDLRIAEQGDRGAAARALFARLVDAPWAGDMTREGALLNARRGVDAEVHEDWCRASETSGGSDLTVEEEVVPAGEAVCVIGTLDAAVNAITARRWRYGPDLIVYRGSADEVLERVGADVGRFARIALAMLGVFALIVAYAAAVG